MCSRTRGCAVRDEYTERFENLPDEYSHLYLAVDGELTAVICIADPLREEAKETIERLKRESFKKVVMMTGDNERTASAIADRLGLDEYYSEVLPEDKANFILKTKENGSKVVMVGDGINDSPAAVGVRRRNSYKRRRGACPRDSGYNYRGGRFKGAYCFEADR